VYACGVQIEVYSDLICPWCYVGHARLAEARRARPATDITVRWLPFELNAAMPPEGRDRREYMLERFGDLSKFDAAQHQLSLLGKSLGLQFNFEAILRSPNTRRAHMLLENAPSSLQGRLLDRFFRAYFTEGKDIGDPATLLSLAEEIGLSRPEAEQTLTDDHCAQRVAALEQQARDWSISGVPTFIFDRRFAFSGAQPLEEFLHAIDACEQQEGVDEARR
jgi:predicted DsbA family dithiol-disulfide isomerase